MKRVFIKGGTIVNSKECYVGDILIEDEKISKIKAEEIKIKEISVEPKKDENVKNYRIDFTLKTEQNSKTYTLYI